MITIAAARSSADHTADRSPPTPSAPASGFGPSTERPYLANLSARGDDVTRCSSFTCRDTLPPPLPPVRRSSSLTGSAASRCSIADARAACQGQALSWPHGFDTSWASDQS